MKKFYFSMAFVAVTITASAQSVGIGTNTPGTSAALDVTSTNKGLLVPRLTQAQRLAIVSPAKGLLVFDSTSNTFWYRDGAVWQELVPSTNAWKLKGNSGTDTAINFLGTTDKKPWLVKVNNIKAGILDTNNNVFWGVGAGIKNPGFDNVAIGHNAFSNGSGGEQVSIGAYSMRSNVSGIWNTALGTYSLEMHRKGSANTAVGYAALASDTSGEGNMASGYRALFSNLNGSYNSASGALALTTNTTGNYNTAQGALSLVSNISGSNNTATGFYALYFNTGDYNTATGSYALNTNGTGNRNTANGVGSLYSNTGGSFNTAIGTEALNGNLLGFANVALGCYALYKNTDRNHLVAAGDSALYNNGIGVTEIYQAAKNTAIGSSALFSNSTGYNNTATGFNALYSNINGSNLVAVGDSALFRNIDGHSNTAIGAGADVFNGAFSNATAIGAGAIAPASNSIQLGNSNVATVNTYGDLTVRNGKGMIRSNDGTQQKKVTTVVVVNVLIAAGATVNIPFSFSETFSSPPDVYVGNATGGGGFAEKVMTVAGVTTTGGFLFVFNPGGNDTPNYSVKIVAIGPQ